MVPMPLPVNAESSFFSPVDNDPKPLPWNLSNLLTSTKFGTYPPAPLIGFAPAGIPY